MDTSLERIRAKIAELEAKVSDLRIAERELHALETLPARRTRGAAAPKPKAAAPKAKRGPKAKAGPRGQTIGAAITDVLDKHGSVSAAEIAEHVKAAGRDITNRTVSFALQALKKRGLAKNTNGKWSPQKSRSKAS
jgi:ribosomal protein L9